MADKLLFIFGAIIITIVGGVFLGMAVYQILRMMRGTIKINLDNMKFKAGDKVEGSFEVITKQNIVCNELSAKLYCYENSKMSSSNNASKRKLLERKQILQEKWNFMAGDTTKYSFSLTIPTLDDEDAKECNLARSVARNFRSENAVSYSLDWWLEIRMDAEGVDLAKHKRLIVKFED